MTVTQLQIYYVFNNYTTHVTARKTCRRLVECVRKKFIYVWPQVTPYIHYHLIFLRFDSVSGNNSERRRRNYVSHASKTTRYNSEKVQIIICSKFNTLNLRRYFRKVPVSNNATIFDILRHWNKKTLKTTPTDRFPRKAFK